MELIKRYWGIIPEQDLGMPLRGKLNLQAIAIPPTPLPCTRIMPASTHSCSPHFSSYVSKAEDKPSIWDSQNLSISIICSALLHFCDLETYQPKGKEWITWSIKKIPVDGECGSKPVCPRGEKFFSICLGILEILFFGVFFFFPFPKRMGAHSFTECSDICNLSDTDSTKTPTVFQSEWNKRSEK